MERLGSAWSGKYDELFEYIETFAFVMQSL